MALFKGLNAMETKPAVNPFNNAKTLTEPPCEAWKRTYFAVAQRADWPQSMYRMTLKDQGG